MKINFKDLDLGKALYINNDPPEEITLPIELFHPAILVEENIKDISNVKYSYFFGIDNVEFSRQAINNNMCFISKDIDIGLLNSNEYIEISSEYSEGDYGSVEFYILDGPEIKAILPIETDIIYNEKIFYGLMPRFIIDQSEPIEIKENGYKVNKTLEQVMNINDAKRNYTITYAPIDAYTIKSNSQTIKIKIIIRCYNLNKRLPYVKNIMVKKYGGL